MTAPRFFLAAPEGLAAPALLACLKAACEVGDVASLLVPASVAKDVTAAAQELGVAVMVSGEARDAARAGADGAGVKPRQFGRIDAQFDAEEGLAAALVEQAHRDGAWVHVDGAFGLWAQASPQFRHLGDGASLVAVGRGPAVGPDAAPAPGGVVPAEPGRDIGPALAGLMDRADMLSAQVRGLIAACQ